MATAVTCSDEPSDGECSICHELLTRPKLLPCGHHLCHHCLVSWIQSKKDAACPLCRCAILRPGERNADVDAESIADGFPTDFFMEKLVEAERLLSKTHSCLVCPDVAATALCLQCGDMMCSSCKQAHTKLSMSRSHVVEDLTSLTAQTLASKRPTTCAAHPEETCRLYCPSHGISLCLVCASTKHRACSDLVELEEKAEEASLSLENLVEKLTAGEEEIERAVDLLDHHWEATEQYVSTAITEIEDTARGLESSVRAWEERVKEQTLKERDFIQAAVREAKECLLQRRGKLSTHKGVVRQGQGMKNREVVDTMVTAMEARVAELNRSSVLPLEAKVVSTLQLTVDKEAVTRFGQELSGLGQVSVSPANNIAIVKPTTLRFHDNHGRHVRVSNFQRTATKTGLQDGAGIVLACDPMQHNFLYEVKVVTVGKKRHKLESVAVGVVTETPYTIDLPDSSANLPSAFVFNRNWLRSPQPEMVLEQWAEAQEALRRYDRVGVSLGSAGDLHLHLNGQDRGVIFSDVPQPCYVMFELCGKAGQITALPVTKVVSTSEPQAHSSASAEAK